MYYKAIVRHTHDHDEVGQERTRNRDHQRITHEQRVKAPNEFPVLWLLVMVLVSLLSGLYTAAASSPPPSADPISNRRSPVKRRKNQRVKTKNGVHTYYTTYVPCTFRASMAERSSSERENMVYM